jgi:putative transcriptional regulator
MTNETGNQNKANLRQLRENAGLTLAELSRQVGVSDRNIWDWEKGISIPRLDRAVALARALNVSLKEICRAMGIEVEDLPSD